MSLFSCPFRPFSSRFLVKKWNILHAFATAKPQQNRSKTAGYGHDKTVPRHEGKHGRRNREEPEKDVLLVLDKQQGKVSAVKGFDKEGNLQTVPPIQGGEFMQVDRNGDIISNLVANFYRKFQDTEGLALFRCKASEVEQNTKAIEDNHRNPTSEDDKRTEALRVPKPDNP